MICNDLQSVLLVQQTSTNEKKCPKIDQSELDGTQ